MANNMLRSMVGRIGRRSVSFGERGLDALWFTALHFLANHLLNLFFLNEDKT